MNARLSAAAVVVSCCLVSCNVQQDVGSQYAKKQDVSALNGGTVTVTRADDPWLENLSLQIPPRRSTRTAPSPSPRRTSACPSRTARCRRGPWPSSAPATQPSPTPSPSCCRTTPRNVPNPGEQLIVVGIGGGSLIRVSGNDLVVDSAHHTVSFITRRLIKYGVLISSNGTTDTCPTGTHFCGCCNNGSCQPDNSPCPAIACFDDCKAPPDGGTGGGTGGGNGGGGSCCGAGETWCGCGDFGKCIGANELCPLACPVQGDPTTGGGTAPPAPTCCGPGTYLCGCGGLGKCIPTDETCPLLCPVCDPTTVETPCGCLPPGAVCGCDPNQPSTVACQCDSRPTPPVPMARPPSPAPSTRVAPAWRTNI